MFSYWRVKEPEKAYPYVRDRLAQAAQVAGKNGMVLVLENEHSCNAGTGRELGRLLKDVNSLPFSGNWRATIRGTLDQVSKRLSAVLDRPVINKTGIQGIFEVKVEFFPDSSVPALMPGGVRRYTLLDQPPLPDEITALPTSPEGASIFTAIQEQAGLRLGPASEARTAPVCYASAYCGVRPYGRLSLLILYLFIAATFYYSV
jgi:uncharacterized protein (TIGR03435 family)